ncbi:MAG: DNA repair protein RadA [Gammaproteobacteria bacterium]|nr:DNA repair protein RadA [Gammaproteobacteria bacterium]
MAKTKNVYSCQTCGAQYPKWAGQCLSCGKWNTIIEETIQATPAARYQGYAISEPSITNMADVTLHEEARTSSTLKELDRVLGGGLVTGSAVLIGGDPGIGKSTLLLQAVCNLSQQMPVLYVTGEESLQQVTLRARRLGLPEKNLLLLADTQVERILKLANQEKPRILVVDSIQTMHTDISQSAPGSVGQVRESAAQLVTFAKQTDTTVFLVGHVTKEGTLAGPRVLEHMVDTVLYFEGEQDSRYRVIRAVKNRFGAVNELGIFAMTDKGLREVSNPSAIFLSRYEKPVSGSVIMATQEGSRPLLVEVQALVDQSHMGNPRRVCVGLESPRLAMLLAVLHRHAGITTYDQDVFVNAVGGVRITETGADLALLLAVLSSMRNRPLPPEVLVFGEVGLAGEIRPVSAGQERLREAAKHGFKKAIVPHGNAPKGNMEELEIHSAHTLNEAVEHFKNFSEMVKA